MSDEAEKINHYPHYSDFMSSAWLDLIKEIPKFKADQFKNEMRLEPNAETIKMLIKHRSTFDPIPVVFDEQIIVNPDTL